MTRMLVSLFIIACQTQEGLVADYVGEQEGRIKQLEADLTACRAELAKKDAAKSASAVIASPSNKTVNLAAQPHLSVGWSIHTGDQIASRVRGDTIEFDPAKIRFHLDPAQQDGAIVGTKLKENLEGQPVLPAQVLDHLLANTGLIPESWKQDEQGNTHSTYFWGTIYRVSDGRRCVRYLYWRGQWRWYFAWLGDGFDDRDPAALLAS